MTKKNRAGSSGKKRENPASSPAERVAARQERSPSSRGIHYWAIVGLFTLSGACGLIYQVIWSRLAVLVFGSTTHAIATVLGVFFLGLALGSFLAGKYQDRFRHPLALYGWLEIGIGIYASLFHLILEGAQKLHHLAFPLLHDAPLPLAVTRVLVAALVLLPPTIMMGATVPLIGDFLTRSPRHVGKDFGLVFAFNTLGAAAGSFLSAFFLIPAIGLRQATWVAAALNFVIGTLSLIWARSGQVLVKREQTAAVEINPGAHSLVSGRQAYAAFVAFALTGFLGLVYEVAWSRALVLVFGSSVYAFATMLTTYLVGLAVGSLVMGRWVDRLRNPLLAFIVVQVVVGLAVFASTAAIGQLPEYFINHFRVDTPWRTIMLLEFAVCFAIMFVPAFGSGMLFPLVARIFMGQRQFRIGRTIADSYAVNTVGCILGSFAAGFVLIPLIGIEMTLLLGAGSNLLIAAGLMAFLPEWQVPRRLAAVTVVIVAALAGVMLFKTWQPLEMNSGVYIYGDPLSRMEKGIDTFVEENRLLYYREGPSDTVAVLESPRGRFLRVNGKTDGGFLKSGRSDNYTQSLLGLLPLLYTPQAEQALVIGLGTGMTLEGVHASPAVNVDCIEISSAVAEGARYFDEANSGVLDSPRVQLRLLDGRTWLAAMPKDYDVIISEPSHPWQTGNANLFTEDFFRASLKRLRPAGVFCQWLPYYQMDKEHFQILLKTVHQSYPYVNVWVVYSDAIVIGSQQPLKIDWPSIQRLVDEPAYAKILTQLDIRSLNELLGFFYLDTAAVENFVRNVSVMNSDNHPIIEYAAPKYLLQRQRGDTFYDMLKISLTARLPVENQPEPAALERARVIERAKYFKRWGVPKEVFVQMLQNY
jgi:spermidine synthase